MILATLVLILLCNMYTYLYYYKVCVCVCVCVKKSVEEIKVWSGDCVSNVDFVEALKCIVVTMYRRRSESGFHVFTHSHPYKHTVMSMCTPFNVSSSLIINNFYSSLALSESLAFGRHVYVI